MYFDFFAVHKLCRTLVNRFCILQLAYYYLFIIHKYVNICSNSQYLQHCNVTSVEPLMDLTPC